MYIWIENSISELFKPAPKSLNVANLIKKLMSAFSKARINNHELFDGLDRINIKLREQGLQEIDFASVIEQ